MRLALRHLLTRLKESPGFHPTVLGLSGLALAVLVAWIGFPGVDAALESDPWRDLFSAETGRTVFPTLAASCITVAGVIFSVTVVGLLQVSAQYGPRLLGSFMRATGTQVVLGIFLGTFVYLLAVMGKLGPAAAEGPQPRLAVLCGLLLAIAGFGSLVFFFHHVTRFIRVPQLLDQVTDDMTTTLARVFPERDEARPGDTENGIDQLLPAGFEARGVPVTAPRTGYVQLFDEDAAVEAAKEGDLVLHVHARPGDFVLEGDPLVTAAPQEEGGEAGDEIRRRLARTFRLGRERTRTQDPEYAVDQVSEMAVRALSSGINDPGTAVLCVDRLTDALARLAERAAPPPARRDDDGRMVLVARRHEHAGMVKAAFARIRQSAGSQLAVILRLLEAIERLARRELPEVMRRQLAEEARQTLALAEEAVGPGEDHRDLDARRRALEEVLGGMS